MKYICKKQLYITENNLINTIFNENAIFFDIETTGFSPSNSTIYLIGCLRKHDNQLILEQFFAETKTDEKYLLEKFMETLEKYTTIISFNGIGFDIPFIKAKCKTYAIDEHLQDFSCIDIFKSVSNIKFLLKLPNYKQKTIEQFLDIKREDLFSGGELILVYEDYLKSKSSELEEILLLHNYEDVLGMLDLLPILSYLEVINGHYTISSVEITSYTSYEGENGQEMLITLCNHYPVPKRVSCQCHGFYLTMNSDISRIRIPLFEGELRYFYPNYKDYYYLPEEDMAIHKSVASFVDKNYRERAKASNCYTRKAGTFLPQYESIMRPFFQKNHKDKCTYFELTEEFSASNELLRCYVDHIFKIFISAKEKDRI